MVPEAAVPRGGWGVFLFHRCIHLSSSSAPVLDPPLRGLASSISGLPPSPLLRPCLMV